MPINRSVGTLGGKNARAAKSNRQHGTTILLFHDSFLVNVQFLTPSDTSQIHFSPSTDERTMKADIQVTTELLHSHLTH